MTEIDLRVVKTLENIDYSLLKNLSSLPFSKITVDIICKCAKINRSTFYKYYSDKFDLLDKYINKILKEFSNNMDAEFIIGTPSELECLVYSNNFRNILDMFNKNKKVYKVLWSADIDRNIYSEMVSIAQTNLLNNLNTAFEMDSSQEEYVSLFSYLFASNLMAVISWWFEHGDHISKEDVVKLMDQITSKGLFITLQKIIH